MIRTVIVRHASAAAVMLYLLSGCGSSGQWPGAWLAHDVGPDVLETGRPILWESTTVQLGDSGFEAHIGYRFYRDDGNKVPDAYAIDVEYRTASASYVAFERNFKLGDLPADMHGKRTSDIVGYDPEKRIVTFQVGEPMAYHLPLPPGKR